MVISKIFTELNQVWHRITILKHFVIIKFPTLTIVSEFSFLASALQQALTTINVSDFDNSNYKLTAN